MTESTSANGRRGRYNASVIARRLGVTEGAVRKASASGRLDPPDADGLYNLAAVRRQWSARTDPRAGRYGRPDSEMAGLRRRMLLAQTERVELAAARERATVGGLAWEDGGRDGLSVAWLMEQLGLALEKAALQWARINLLPPWRGTEDAYTLEALIIHHSPARPAALDAALEQRGDATRGLDVSLLVPGDFFGGAGRPPSRRRLTWAQIGHTVTTWDSKRRRYARRCRALWCTWTGTCDAGSNATRRSKGSR